MEDQYRICLQVVEREEKREKREIKSWVVFNNEGFFFQVKIKEMNIFYIWGVPLECIKEIK